MSEENNEIIVRAVENKPLSAVEQEKQFIQEEEEKRQAEDLAAAQESAAAEEQPAVIEIKDEDVLSYIKNKHNRELTSIDDLFKEPEVRVEKEEIQYEDVKAFLEYKKETGRGIEDFIKLQRDLDKEDPNSLLADYYREVEEMDSEDIKFQMRRFAIDEDLMDEDEIAAKRLEFKKELKKAKKHFDGLKEKYKAPLESRAAELSGEDREEFESFKSKTKADQELAAQRSKVFAEKTDKLFSDNFEGFGYNIDENTKLTYKPAETSALKQQSNIQNFISKFLDDDGTLKGDGSEFHKAIAMAIDPDKSAKFFYEKGIADAIERLEKEGKNIELRSTAPPAPKDGITVRVIDNSHSQSTVKFRKR